MLPRLRSHRPISWPARALVACLLLASLIACGTAAPAPAAPESAPIDRNATLRLAWSSIPTQLDPHRSVVDIIDFRVLNLVYDRLLTITPDGTIGPMLATAWEYAPDGMSLSLTLREGVTFHDGTPLDAAAVVTNLERARTIGSSISAKMANVAAVSATAPNQVRVDLKAPTTEVPAVLAQNAGLIINPKLLASGDPATTADGSGPYTIESFEPGVSVVLTRAPDADKYWDQDATQLARIEHTRIADPKALTSALRAGQVDAAQLSAPELVADVQSEVDRGTLAVTPIAQQSFVAMYINHQAAPLDNLLVRQAINQAVDRKALADAFFPGSGPAVQVFRESDPQFDAQLGDPYPFDTAAARQKLAEAGYPDGIDLPVMVSTAIPGGLGEAVQAMLGEAGIRAQLQVTDSQQIFAEFAKGTAPIALNFGGSQGSPAATIDQLTGPAFNPGGRTDDFTTLFSAANDNRKSADEQNAGYQAATGYIAEQAWFAPLISITYPWIHTPRVAGLSVEEMDFASTRGAYDWRHVGLRAES